MKRTLKQFLAAAMAGVMTLSMVVTASASANSYRTGTMNGVGANQGPAPVGTVDVVLPTAAAAGNGSAGELDLVIDAHGLLKATEGARYQNSDKSVTFDDGNIFFKSMIPATKAQEVTVTVTTPQDEAGTYTAMLYKKVTVDKTKTGYISDIGSNGSTAGTSVDVIVDASGADVTGTGKDFDGYAPANVETPSEDTQTKTVVKTGKKAMITVTSDATPPVATPKAMEAVNPATVDFAYLYVNKTESAKSRVWSDASGTAHATLTTATVEALEKAGYVAVPVQDEVPTYTKDSKKFEFINKSPAAVTVAVTAVLTKGNGNKFELVDSASDLANEDEDGKVNGAQMYLALVNATDADNEVVNVVQDPATEPNDDGTATYVIPGDIRTYNAYTTDTTGNNPTVGSLTMLQGDPTFEWAATADRVTKDAFNTAIAANGGSGISLAYTKNTDTVTASLASLSGYTVAMLPEDEPTAESFVGGSIARKAVATISRGDDEIARVTFVVDGKSIKAVGTDIVATQVVKFDKWVESSQASSISSVPCNTKANKAVWDGTNNKYTFTSNPLVTNDKFSKAVFYLTTAINTVDAWDLVDDTNLKMDLVYDIGEYIEGLSPAIPAATDPTATVATKAEAATSNFTVKYTLGTGDKMFDNLATLVYTMSTGKEAKLDPTNTADGVATFKCSQNVFGGSDWKIRFTNDDDDKTFDVPVTIKD